MLLTMLDLSAAIDCIDLEILLNHLERSYGIQFIAHRWLKSNLTDSTQYVHHNGHMSYAGKMCYDVPQGTVLGHFFCCTMQTLMTLSATMVFITLLRWSHTTSDVMYTCIITAAVDERYHNALYQRYQHVDVVQPSTSQPTEDGIHVMHNIKMHA